MEDKTNIIALSLIWFVSLVKPLFLSPQTKWYILFVMVAAIDIQSFSYKTGRKVVLKIGAALKLHRVHDMARYFLNKIILVWCRI